MNNIFKANIIGKGTGALTIDGALKRFEDILAKEKADFASSDNEYFNTEMKLADKAYIDGEKDGITYKDDLKTTLET